ncbi:MAG: V0D/AC39 family V-type ATPase subunit [Brevinema sp.]
MFSVQYIPLSVRVRAWNLSLFSQQDLENLIYEDFHAIMLQVAQKEKILPIDTSSYHNFISSTDHILLEYLKIASANTIGMTKSFIRALFHEFEISNLKNVARMCISGKFQEVFTPYVFTPSLTIKKLSEVRTINELIHLLDDSPYKSFKHILEQVEQERNALYWELALDNYFVSKINHIAKRLDFSSRKAIKTLLLFPLQQSRLVSLYRYRFHYQVEPSEALKYVPNLTSFMTLEEWSRLAFSVSNVEFYNYLIEMGYIPEDTPNYASNLSMVFQKQLEQVCQKLIHQDLTSIASFLAFIQLKKIQLKKIVTILESKGLQVSNAEVMQFL